eukprot:scaffold601_cov496-Prasinococcus_capsulatus_cf.AAC.4
MESSANTTSASSMVTSARRSRVATYLVSVCQANIIQLVAVAKQSPAGLACRYYTPAVLLHDKGILFNVRVGNPSPHELGYALSLVAIALVIIYRGACIS